MARATVLTRCLGCKIAFTLTRWRKLAHHATAVYAGIGTFELRHCACGTTLMVEIVDGKLVPVRPAKRS